MQFIATGRVAASLLGVAFLLALAGCGSDDNSNNQPAPGPGVPGTVATVTVAIPSGASALTNDAFGTNPLNVTAGTTVTWVNNDNVPHTVTSEANPPTFDSGNLAPGQSFSYTFREAGEFPYFCRVHPGMRGNVRVAAPAGPPGTVAP